MVGDLFFWSFCCLRLWRRDKKPTVRGSNGVYEAGTRRGKEISGCEEAPEEVLLCQHINTFAVEKCRQRSHSLPK
ncbi:hypothetical protein EYF80_059449 [Liparis tanakae]|uniref:Uncharacterized protein n=1 Tax=Liparis tanakae TaxID=230148 RepID=A0A4Z2ENS5_9TELE|nr:hypothetical protein EYF80_059449 [Liparis tanakae]